MAQEATTQKKKVSRTAVKKVKDKWKAKQWFSIRAPKMYNGVVIAETLADETDKLVGRVAEATLQDLSGDFSKMHVKLYFKVNGVKGTEAVTKFTGHELTSDYIRRLTRRKHSKIDGVYDVTTSDGWTIRVKPMAVTEKRAQSTQEQEIRRIAERICIGSAKDKSLPDFVREMVNGDLAMAIFKDARKIYPLKRVEIRKSVVLREPENLLVEEDVFAMPLAGPGMNAEQQPAAASPEGDGSAAEIADALAEGGAKTGELTEEEQVGDKP